ncbi:MAG: hypothetical protein RIS50_1764, partial [Bacteroidota bacterium]
MIPYGYDVSIKMILLSDVENKVDLWWLRLVLGVRVLLGSSFVHNLSEAAQELSFFLEVVHWLGNRNNLC